MAGADVQTTVAVKTGFAGFGLHSGLPARVTVHPAPADHGIWFQRSDVATGDRRIEASWRGVVPARLCTRLTNRSGVEISTVEHILAALAGCGVTNARVEVDGPEIPILDGSARPFVTGLLKAGFRVQAGPRRVVRVLKPVSVTRGAASAELAPARQFEMAFEIAFPDPAIGRQSKRLVMSNGTFVRELADSRTFCRRAEIEEMRAAGLAKGGTFENAVVVDGATVLTPGGLRHPDEPVRHKMLDAFGDLSLAGAPILGKYTGHRAGHALTGELLGALFADPHAYRVESLPEAELHRLPGTDLTDADLHAVA